MYSQKEVLPETNDLSLEQKYLLRLVLIAALTLGAAFLGSHMWHLLAFVSQRMDAVFGLIR